MQTENDVNNDIFYIPCLEHRKFLTADEWAEQNMILRDTGKFRYSETPWMREPTKATSDVFKVCRVIISTCSQAGKSSAIVNCLCHQAVFHPANSMLLLDTHEATRRIVKNRLRPALRDFAKVPSLQKGQTAHVLDVSAECSNIAFASGANLICASAKSVSALASTPVQLLCLDEVDRYEQDLGVEGDPVILAIKRTIRYKNSMVLMTSTPTTPDGRITKHYDLGTQEVWSAVCPCGCYMPVLFDDIDFSGDVPTYACPNCGIVYNENDVINLPHTYAPPLNQNPFTDKNGRIARSFKVTAPLVHSAYSWSSIEAERKQAEAIGLPAVRSWKNTCLGEPFTPPSVSVSNFEGLMDHRIFFDNNSIPSWIKYIVTGIDTQDSRFELVVVGVSEDTHAVAVIQHKIIFGDILTDFAPWNELKDFLANTRFITQDNRTLPIALSMIDAGGHATQEVFALGLQTPYIRPVRGRCYRLGEQENSIIDRIQRKGVTQIGTGTGRVDLTWVNTRFTKDLIYYKLSEILKNRDAQLYFSASPESLIDENFFEQITSEEKYDTAKGYSNYRLKVGKRNECLDCLVYALAGAESIRLSLCKMPSVSNNIDNIQFSEPVAQSKNIGKNDIMIPQSSLSNNDKRIIDNNEKKQDNINKPINNHLKKKYKPL